jgi:hypothetical protein
MRWLSVIGYSYLFSDFCREKLARLTNYG